MLIEKNEQFVVLGSSGWLGHYVVPALSKIIPNSKIVAVYRSKTPFFSNKRVEILKLSMTLNSLSRDFPFGTIINLNRGETDADFEFHEALIKLQNTRKLRYIYASSFNAVDENLSTPHAEEEIAASRTAYGKFKARCEEVLLNTCERPVVFRFSATHGWAPNREARTQDFLRRLAKGENIEANPGVIQNRSFVGDLAIQIAMLASRENAKGVFHLGTSDFSEELVFLRNLAVAFGYDPEAITEGESTICNAVMLMKKFALEFPHYNIPLEADTIRKVSSQLELASFKCI